MLLLFLLLLLLQVSGDLLAGCIVTATYNTISAAAKGGRSAMATLTDR
jgi:outer membrane murein-binding lipoprotein Lpp